MSIYVECARCDQELTEPGGILLGPPMNLMTTKMQRKSLAEKEHLCVDCYWKVARGHSAGEELEWLINFLKENFILDEFYYAGTHGWDISMYDACINIPEEKNFLFDNPDWWR